MMKYNPFVQHRQSIRLRGYDYTQPGEYFVTICTSERERLFGEIENEEIRLSDIGRIVREEWLRTPLVRSNVQLDKFVVMPDHLHGIIVILAERNGATVGANCELDRIREYIRRNPLRWIGEISHSAPKEHS